MYHLRDVTLSFTMHKWQTYECPKDSLPKQGGLGWVSSWGGSSFNPSPQPPVIKRLTPYGEVFLFDATPL